MPVSTSMSVTANVSATAADSHRQRRKGPGPEPRAKVGHFAEELRHQGSMGYCGAVDCAAGVPTVAGSHYPWTLSARHPLLPLSSI